MGPSIGLKKSLFRGGRTTFGHSDHQYQTGNNDVLSPSKNHGLDLELEGGEEDF